MAFPVQLLPQTASAAGSPTLDMGYGPSTLFPVSGGTPVYSAGDQLWVRSHYGSAVQVAATPLRPNATSYKRTAEPDVPMKMLSFNDSDQGLWTLQTANQSAPSLVFLVSFAGATPANLTLVADRLKGESLSMNFTTSNSVSLYDANACLLGGSDSSRVVVPVPKEIGVGNVVLSRQGDIIGVTGAGLGNENFTLSVEIYRSYSFLSPNSTTTLLSRNARVATTSTVLVSGREFVPPLTIQSDAPLKTGEDQLRVYFQGAGGLALSTTQVLFPDQNTWVWLGDCQTKPVYSNDFNVVSQLGTDPAAWPREAWLTYTSYGEQGFASVPLGIDIASVTFVGAPWGVKLSIYSIGASAASGVLESGSANGTLFMILDSQNANFTYTAGLGNQTLFTGRVGGVRPFTSTILSINVSKLEVTYDVGGVPYQGGAVGVADAAGTVSSASTDSAGNAVFYLPEGDYNVTASGGNSSASQSVSLAPGQALQVTLGKTQSVWWGTPLIYSLAAAAGLGVVANVALVLWRRTRPRTGVLRSARSQSDGTVAFFIPSQK
ncbi:MAG: carboxypeptidase regulatory-like domain-containing protein [Thaumarchaeota archaeon]|nr:carboxypeptidase regulatory-like domain-containing protein [Nitrososphaerota archaeon]